MLIRVPFQVMAVNFARMVIPRSRSRSFESIAQSAMTSPARKVPACRKNPSTSVVFPWSTCAMIAMLRTSCLTDFGAAVGSRAGFWEEVVSMGGAAVLIRVGRDTVPGAQMQGKPLFRGDGEARALAPL